MAEKIISKSIVIIDDNRDAANSLASLLKMYGHKVSTGYSGMEAIDMVKDIKPEFLLLDIGLPEKNGYEIVDDLVKNNLLLNTKVVAVTGYGQKEDIEMAEKMGFYAFLTKPINIAELNKILSR